MEKTSAPPKKLTDQFPETQEDLDFPKNARALRIDDRTIDLDGEEDIAIAVTFKMSKTLYKELGQTALDKEVSRASIIRSAVKERLKNLEHPEYAEFWNLWSDFLKQIQERFYIDPNTTIEELLQYLKENVSAEQEKQEKK